MVKAVECLSESEYDIINENDAINDPNLHALLESSDDDVYEEYVNNRDSAVDVPHYTDTSGDNNNLHTFSPNGIFQRVQIR